MKAIRMHTYGDPSVLTLEDVPDPVPNEGEVLVRVGAVGLNYAETVARRGAYPTPPFPFIPGSEAAGEVVKLGKGVRGISEGAKVMFTPLHGAYAEYATASAAEVEFLPKGFSIEEGAAFRVNFLTAYLALKNRAMLRPGESVLIHSAAGGVGTAAIQLAKLMGGRIFATVGSKHKMEIVAKLGADHVINYLEEDFVAAVKKANDGKGPDVILESGGGEIFDKSFNSLAPFGRMVVFGIASGQGGNVQTISEARIPWHRANSSLLGLYLGGLRQAQPEVVREALHDLLSMAENGRIRPVIGQTFPLAQAAKAHEFMASRQSHGKIVLIP